MRRFIIFPLLATLAACSSAPKPPTVSGNNRQPVNTIQTAEVLALKAELAEVKATQAAQPKAVKIAPIQRRLISAYFPFNGTVLSLSQAQQADLYSALTPDVRHIHIRGRTDGRYPSPGDEAVALKRAVSAKDWLVRQGVSPAKISVNYLSAGDYVAENNSAQGRAQNRRVDIEVFYN